MKKNSLTNLSSAVLIIVMALALLPATSAKASGEVITSTATGGAWGDDTTWVGGSKPDSLDDSVVIATTDGNSVFLNGAKTVKGSLTINSGAELDTGNYALTLEGDFVNHVDNGLFFAGDSNITIAGTASTQNIAGFTTAGNVSMTKTAGVATFTGNVSAAGLTLTGSGGTLHLGTGKTHTFSGAWTRTNGTLDGGSSTLNLYGTVTGSTGTFTPGTSKFYYMGTTQNVAGVAYYRLRLQGNGVKTALGNITVNENLTINSPANFTVGAYDITVTGTTSVTGTLTHSSSAGTKTYSGLATINPGGTWSNTGNADIHFRNGLTHNGATFSAGTGMYYFETNNQAIGGTSALTIPKITIEAARTLTNNNSGGLSVTTTLAGEALTQGASGVLNLGMADVGFTLTTLNASAVGNTVNYSYGGNQTVEDVSYHHLILSTSGTKTLPAGLTHLTGSLTLSGTATNATTLADLDIDGDLSIANSAVLTVGAFNFNVDGNTSITGTSSSVNGKLTYGSATGTKSFIGPVTIGGNGIWDNINNAPVNFEGGLSFSGKTFTGGTGSYTFQTTAGQSIGGTAALTIPNLVVDAGVNLTNNNSAGLTVNATLSGTGTLTQGAAGILNIGMAVGSFTLTTLDFSTAGNTVNYSGGVQTVRPVVYHHLALSGTSAKNVSGLTTVNGNLTLSGSATTTTTDSNLAVGGNLTIGSGTTVYVGGFDITVTGATSVTGTLTHNDPAGTKLYVGLVTVNGAWENTGDASFTLRGGLNGTIAYTDAGPTAIYTFDTTPAQTIDGTISVYNLAVASGVTLTNDGTITVLTALSGAGTWAQGTTGVLNIGGTSSITTLTASAVGNTVNYNGASPQTLLGAVYHHLTLSGGSAKTLPAGLTTVNGNLTLSTGGTFATLAADLTIGGNLLINSSTTLDVSASNYATNVGGNWTGSGTFTPHSGTVTLQGTGAQNVNNGSNSFYNLVLNNAAGATLVTNNATVNNVLTLTSGKVTTSAKILIIGSGGSISGASATNYVNGNLQKAFATSGSPQSFTFEIGDATTYAPVDVTIASVGTAGNLTAKTAATEHPNIATLIGFNPNKDVNRYWTLTPASIVFSIYDATFNFAVGDLDAGTTPTSFIVKRYQASSPTGWNSTTVGTQTATSTQATGIPYTSSSNVYSYAVGEGEDIAPTVTNVTSSTLDGLYNAGDVISGFTVTFSEPVDVMGTPQLTLETGTVDAILNYSGGTGTNTLTFTDYTVLAGDTTSDLDANSLTLNGGTIKDTSKNPATLTLSGTTLATNKAIVIDTTAPNTQIDSQPVNPTNSTSAAFTFSATESSTFQCRLDGGAYEACASPYTLAAGSHTFAVRATDLAGNVDATPATYAWTIDTTAPNTQIDTKPANPTNSTSAAFTFSATEPSTFQCKIDGGSYGACASPYTLAAGPHTFTVRATDLAGNVDATPATYTWTIDTTAPNTQIDTKPANPSNSTSAAFTYSATEPSTFQCKMDGGSYGACASPYTLAAGPHTFTVRAIDLAGNVDATPATYAWTIDTTAPTVLSSARVHANPTANVTVQFTVTFSEPVTGVNATDFSLTLVTVTGASVTTVTGSGTTYIVTVNTGSGNGTIKLNVLDNDSIKDLALNPQNGAFTTGAVYTVNKTFTYQSVSTNDGWVLESTATSTVGGSFDNTANTFKLGDDTAKKQFRSILHFNTANLPDTAVITSVTLKFLKASGGSGNTASLGALLADMTRPSFGLAALANGDFQATAGKPSIFNAFSIASSWYSATMKSTGFTYVNRTGTTQFRLRFTTGDDGDGTADYLLFYSGNIGTTTSRPQLIINYYVP